MILETMALSLSMISRVEEDSPLCNELAHRAARAVESESTEFKRDYFFYRVILEKAVGTTLTYEVDVRAGTPGEAKAANRGSVAYIVVTEKSEKSCSVKQILRGETVK